LCGFHFFWHFTPGDLSANGMDTVQSARYLARTGHFGTQIIRPLLAGRLEPFPDGAIPDLAHPPLFPILAAGIIRVSHHTSVGQGDRDTVLVTVLFFALSIGSCYLLARRLFPAPKGNPLFGIVPFSCLFYIFGTTGLFTAILPSPLTLACLLFTLLLLLLHSLDTASIREEDIPRRKLLRGAFIAGLIYGVLYLSLYSALLLLPALLLYLWRISRRELGPSALFIFAALLVSTPLLYRNWHLTGYPFYNGRLYDLLANTSTYPGYGLYRNGALLLPLPQYLANGGIVELFKKALGNLLGIYTHAPMTLGIFMTPLFLGAALTRFTDRRINRLRTLIYSCLALHLVGMAFFETPEEAVSVLLIYGPFVAVVSAAFLMSVLRARNWPVFLYWGALSGWTFLTCLPGLIQLFIWPIPPNRDTVNSNIYYYLNTDSAEMQVFRKDHSAMVATDAPWDIAFRCDYPAIWLPNDTGVFQVLARKFHRPIAGVFLSSKLRRDYDGDADAVTYVTTYDRLLALAAVAGKMDRETRAKMVTDVKLFYPARISDAMQGFQPQPLLEDDGDRYSMLFWNHKVLDHLQKTHSTKPSVK
jgi:4-amino-4-deoxy-L-arabinose transferase-like glycosyltransferase